MQGYEKTLNILNSIKEEDVNAETEDGENLRRQLIYQDYINRGFKPERAKKEADKSVDNGTDKEDALEALESSKDYFKSEYDSSSTFFVNALIASILTFFIRKYSS